MSANQPPPSPNPPPPSSNRGALVAIIGVVAVVGIIVAVMEVRSRGREGTTPTGPTPIGQTSIGDAPPAGAFDVPDRPEPTYGELENAPSTSEVPELFWLDVYEPKSVHDTLRKNAWLGKVMKDPLGQGFVAAWGGFFGTRGEDVGKAFTGAVSALVLDEVLATPYRVVWYGGEGAKGAPAVVIPAPSAAAVSAFDTLVKVAASGGFNAPHCVRVSPPGDGGVTPQSIHRIVLADKILFAAHLDDRVVLAPRPQAVMLAMCEELKAIAPRPGIAASLGFSVSESGRGTQSVGQLLGIGDVASLEFAIENGAFAPKGLTATAENGGRLAAAAPSQELLKAIPEKSGVVLFLAVKLPKELTATSLRDTLASSDENFGGAKKEWPLEARQVAVIWNPRGNKVNEVAVLWGNTADEKAIAEAMVKGNNALQVGKACSVLAYASTKELMAELQGACSGKKPSMLQAAQPIVKGLSESSSMAISVNLGRVLSQLTLDGWLSEHPAPNANTGPQEIEAARKLLEELPTMGFRATVGSDGKITSGGFRS